MNKKTNNSTNGGINQEVSEKDKFVAVLQKMAGEQRRLEQTSVMPRWMGPVNSMIGTNAFALMLVSSLCISIVIFLVKFPFFFELGRQLL